MSERQTKAGNLMLIVYLPKIFSSVAGLFHLDPLLLLSAGTVLTSEPSVSCFSGVLVCVPHLGSVTRVHSSAVSVETCF